MPLRKLLQRAPVIPVLTIDDVAHAVPLAEALVASGLTVLEVYGQSEGSGPTTVTRPGSIRAGTVGPAFPGVEVKIAEDGEILVRGRNVFPGYFREPAATAECLIDGWLHSGDLGALDGLLTQVVAQHHRRAAGDHRHPPIAGKGPRQAA